MCKCLTRKLELGNLTLLLAMALCKFLSKGGQCYSLTIHLVQKAVPDAPPAHRLPDTFLGVSRA